MDAQTLETLERQRELVEHFIGLSREHLLLWEGENQSGLEPIFERRALLMCELTMMADTVTEWIREIYANPLMAGTSFEEVRQLNEEIVDVATHIIDIDERLRQNFQGSRARRPECALD